ncbi:MAG: hypothetical protein ACR2QC_11500 [Gammaproteobacteria bacterium]
MNKEIPAFAGMAVLFVFADNTEFGGIRKYKNTPFRRKPESLSPIRRKAATICAFGAEIPAFAGMGRSLKKQGRRGAER